MEMRSLGATGERVSALCMGCWEIGGQAWGDFPAWDGVRLVQQAFDAGITTFDTAEVYGNGRSEVLLGEALYGRRDDAFIISKVGYCPAPMARSPFRAPSSRVTTRPSAFATPATWPCAAFARNTSTPISCTTRRCTSSSTRRRSPCCRNCRRPARSAGGGYPPEPVSRRPPWKPSGAGAPQ